MRTPSGTECRFYHQDFYRGRSVQECRLLGANPQSLQWEPKICARCPVPDILRANNCPNMTLNARLVKRWLRKQVQVQAYCTQHQVTVQDPYVGCGHCHPGGIVFTVGEE